MLAKRPVQTQKTGRLDNRFREQARSHKACVQRQALQLVAHVVINYGGVPSPAAPRSCGSELAREEASADTKNRASGQSLSRASSLPQSLRTTPSASAWARMSSSICRCAVPGSASVLWERACSRRGQCRHIKQGVWTIVFASKLAPTKPAYNAKRFSVGAHVVIKYGGVPSPAAHRSHKACVQRQALQCWGACRHQIRRRAVPGSASLPQSLHTTPSASVLGRMSSSNTAACRPR
ncbi:Hypothetical protein PssSM_0332 [Pseudomonas syringae pv. syringae SM]|nr:Hypothetical protein PssSM_0332 [Pseudomonas syringae pv. syringae SM]